jgi:hypothetical protein
MLESIRERRKEYEELISNEPKANPEVVQPTLLGQQ